VVDPVVDLTERCGIDGVQPTRAFGADRREPALPQHLEVLGHGRLGDPELRLDDGRDGPGRELALGEQLEDPSSDGVAQDIERVHGSAIVEATAYISQS
jgi:hypothetical protein